MNGAVRVSPYIERAGRVASRYLRLPLRPERDRLCKACEAADEHDTGRDALTNDAGGEGRRALQ